MGNRLPAARHRRCRSVYAAGQQCQQLETTLMAAAARRLLSAFNAVEAALVSATVCLQMSFKCKLDDERSLNRMATGTLALVLGAGQRLLLELEASPATNTGLPMTFVTLNTQMRTVCGLVRLLQRPWGSGAAATCAAVCAAVAQPAPLLAWVATTGRMIARMQATVLTGRCRQPATLLWQP